MDIKGYSGKLRDGRDIYIPNWSVKVQFENLTQVCKYLGQDNVISIAEKRLDVAMLAIMESKEPRLSTDLVLHFVGQARIEGVAKIENIDVVNELGMSIVLELFMHVIHSQFHDFFVSGLAKEPSQDSLDQEKEVVSQ